MAFVSTSCIKGSRDLDSVLSAYASLGIRNVELGSSHPFAPDMLETVRRYGFSYIIHNYFPPPQEGFILNLASPNPATLARSIVQAKSSVDFAAAAGAKLVSLHAGFSEDPGPGFRFRLQKVDKAPAEQRLVAALKGIAAYAKERGIAIALENNVVAGHNIKDGFTPLLFAAPGECVRILDSVGSANLGMLLDLGHLNVSAHSLGFDRDAFLDEVRESVREVHVHENDGNIDQHLGLARGSWFENAVSSFKDAKGIRFTLESCNLDGESVVKNLRMLEEWVS